MGNVVEYCQYCENESEMVEKFIPQPCEHCGEILLPCRLCQDLHDSYKEVFGDGLGDPACDKCPFEYRRSCETDNYQ